MLLCYADDIPALAEVLDVRPAEAGSNVMFVIPFDPVVYERTTKGQGVTVAAPSQVAADLLTSPGRGPNEAEALIEWMRGNEDAGATLTPSTSQPAVCSLMRWKLWGRSATRSSWWVPKPSICTPAPSNFRSRNTPPTLMSLSILLF